MALANKRSQPYHMTMGYRIQHGLHLWRGRKRLSKPTKPVNTQLEQAGGGMPFVMFIGLFGLGLISYVLSQLILSVEAHSIHWLVA